MSSKMTGYNRAQIRVLLVDRVKLTELQAEKAMEKVDSREGKETEISKAVTIKVTRHGDYYSVEL